MNSLYNFVRSICSSTVGAADVVGAASDTTRCGARKPAFHYVPTAATAS